MFSRTQSRRGLLALGLLLMLSGSCQFSKVEDDVVFACAPDGSCASAEQLCSKQSLCLPRNQAIRIVQPENNAQVKGSTTVEAVVDVPGVDPDSLVLTITQQGQGPFKLTLKRQEAGRYLAQWIPSRGEGDYELRVSAPDEGLESALVTVVLDNDTPSFTVEVPSPTGPTSTGALTSRDPEAPTAWRRDEHVVVTVTSDDADVDAESVRLIVVGAGINDSEGRAEPAVAPRQVPTCAHAYCGVVELDLAVPELSRFRGPLKLQVRGKDQAGNSASGSGEVLVTRWRWELNAGADIVTSTAIGQQGSIYMGVRSRDGGGRVLRVRPGGAVETVSEGVLAYDALAIGPTLAGGSEVLYLTQGPGGGSAFPGLIAIRASDGQVLGECRASVAATQHNSRLVVGSGPANDSSTRDVAFAGFYDATLDSLEMVALRLDTPTPVCLRWVPLKTGSFSALVTTGPRFFFTEASTWQMSAEAGGLKDHKLDPSCAPGAARLALAGPELIASEFNGGRSSRVKNGLCQPFELGGATAKNRISSLALDAQSRLFYGKQGDGNTYHLSRSPLDQSSSTLEHPLPTEIATAPILGQGGWLYTATKEGQLQVWNRDLEVAWTAPQLAKPFRAAMTLDCARSEAGQPQNRPGVWYLAHDTRLRAITVDSHGLDTAAPWPTSQHDPLQSGNSSVDLTKFKCP